jgi:hypothetical protein
MNTLEQLTTENEAKQKALAKEKGKEKAREKHQSTDSMTLSSGIFLSFRILIS